MAAAAPAWPRSCGLSSSESKGVLSPPPRGASPRTGLSLNNLGAFSGTQGGIHGSSLRKAHWGPARLSGWPWALLCPHSLALDHLNCLVLKTVNLQRPLKQWHLDLKVPHQWLHFSALRRLHQRCSSPVMSRPQVTWRGQPAPQGCTLTCELPLPPPS